MTEPPGYSRCDDRVGGMNGNSERIASTSDGALEAWRARWNLPILLAAIVPLIVTSPQVRAVAIVVGLGSWLVFVVDLIMQRRIAHDYLRTRNGRIDLAIVLITFPYYLIPGAGGYSALLVVARLARVGRLLMATRGLRRFAARLGQVVTVAGVMLVVCSLAAYEAEHSTNTEFGTVGDAFWWGIVTLTTVGYGDIVPKTTAGRLAGVALMVTGIAVLGVLAGTLASLFHVGDSEEGASSVRSESPLSLSDELTVLRAELQGLERRVAELAERARQ